MTRLQIVCHILTLAIDQDQTLYTIFEARPTMQEQNQDRMCKIKTSIGRARPRTVLRLQ